MTSSLRGGVPASDTAVTAAASDTAVTAGERAREVVAAVLDPEVPVLTIDDLGVLRDVRVRDGRVEVTITPTYSGCPAMEAIRADIEHALHRNGFRDVSITTVLSPAWTTDWMSDEGRRKLAEYGIAPPGRTPGRTPASTGGGPGSRRTPGSHVGTIVPVALSVRCPQCGSPDTREVSRFGSTACKALWSCNSCLGPFDHFKAI